MSSSASEVLVEDMALYAERYQVTDMLEEYMRRSVGVCNVASPLCATTDLTLLSRFRRRRPSRP